MNGPVGLDRTAAEIMLMIFMLKKVAPWAYSTVHLKQMEKMYRVIPGERNYEIETAVWIWPVSYYVL